MWLAEPFHQLHEVALRITHVKRDVERLSGSDGRRAEDLRLRSCETAAPKLGPLKPLGEKIAALFEERKKSRLERRVKDGPVLSEPALFGEFVKKVEQQDDHAQTFSL